MKLGIFLDLIREVLLIIIILSDRSLGYTSKPRYGSYCAKKGQVHTSCRPTCLPSNNRQNSQKIPSFECRSFNFSSHTPTMNWLRQAVVQIAYSQPTTKRTILRLRIMALLAQSYFTKQPRKAKLAASDIWQPPREIPFQVKVATWTCWFGSRLLLTASIGLALSSLSVPFLILPYFVIASI